MGSMWDKVPSASVAALLLFLALATLLQARQGPTILDVESPMSIVSGRSFRAIPGEVVRIQFWADEPVRLSLSGEGSRASPYRVWVNVTAVDETVGLDIHAEAWIIMIHRVALCGWCPEDFSPMHYRLVIRPAAG